MTALIIIAAILAGLGLLYTVQPKYRKLFIKNLLSQVKYLIPRYFT
jgi:hypothetical protein